MHFKAGLSMKTMDHMPVVGEINLLFPLLLLPLLFLILKRITTPSSLKGKHLPPGPYPWPLIGNILSMRKNPHVSLTNLAQSHGPLMSLQLGTKVLVVASSPATATEILKTHDRILSARYLPNAIPATDPSIGWTECNDQWNMLRTVCRTELLSAKAIESQRTLREKKVLDLVGFLGTKEGEMVTITEVVFATVLNILSNLFVSKDFISFEDDGGEEGLKGLVRRLMVLGTTLNLGDYYPILSGLDLQGLRRKSVELVGRVSATWEPILKQRRERKSCDDSIQGDFLDVLIGNGYKDDLINELLMELFGAGADTTSLTVEWAMAELIKDEEAMNKVRAELVREIKGNALRESDLPNLPYLHACVKETLRLHPPAPFLLPRRSLETCEVMNYTIPKNSQVLVNVWAIGRDPMIWDNPLVFNPDRFLNSELDYKGNDFTYIPFGSGRRMCPGLLMANKQVHLILASLIYYFDWSLPHNMNPAELDMNEKFGLTLEKEKYLVLVPKVRK